MVKQNIRKKDWKNKSEIVGEIFQKKEKNIKREYGRNRYENMFEEQNKKLKEYGKSNLVQAQGHYKKIVFC